MSPQLLRVLLLTRTDSAHRADDKCQWLSNPENIKMNLVTEAPRHAYKHVPPLKGSRISGCKSWITGSHNRKGKRFNDPHSFQNDQRNVLNFNNHQYYTRF